MEVDKYKMAYEKRKSSSKDIRAFAVQILQDEGFDPSIVNFKTEGVSIEALNKLIEALYMAGYKDGLIQYANLTGEQRNFAKTGKALEYHKRIAKNISEQKIYNK